MSGGGGGGGVVRRRGEKERENLRGSALSVITYCICNHTLPIVGLS